jgi:osmoprotectant transport system substrate-binding protein
MAAAVAMAVAACAGSSGPAVTPTPDPEAVTIASFDFDESRLLTEIYGQALEHHGFTVRRELDLGPRELVHPALQQGKVDLVPDYLGSALASLRGADDGAALGRDDGLRELRRLAGPLGLVVGEPAPAENRNVFTVTRGFSSVHGITAISELATLRPGITLGGPAECPDRPYCLLGLQRVYGLDVERFVPVQGAARVRRALEEELIDVGVLFSTDGELADPGLVALVDDRALNPAEHVVPLVRAAMVAGHGEQVLDVLDGVSARLTTEALRFLGWRVAVAGNAPAAEARGWLVRQGLIGRA